MTTPSLSIRQEIGAWPEAITASEFIAQLDALGDVPEFTFYINSEGGSVFHSSAMMAALNRHPARKIGVIEGICASAATFVAMSVDELQINESAFFMVHFATSGVLGDKRDMAKQSSVLDQLDSMIAGIYAARAGGDARDWLALMEAETWLTAAELEAMGMAKLIPNKGPVRGASAKATRSIANRSVRAASIVNSLTSRSKRRPAASAGVQAKLREYAAVAASVVQDGLDYKRDENRYRIVANAHDPAQAKRYLRWS